MYSFAIDIYTSAFRKCTVLMCLIVTLASFVGLVNVSGLMSVIYINKGRFRGQGRHAPKMPNIVQHDTKTKNAGVHCNQCDQIMRFIFIWPKISGCVL